MITIEPYQAHPAKHANRAQRWRWRATTANNRKLASSAEAYTNKADALAAIHQLFGDTTDIVLQQPDHDDQQLRTGAPL